MTEKEVKAVNPIMTADQRKALADLLKLHGEAHQRARDNHRDALSTRRSQLIGEAADKHGASKFFDRISELQREESQAHFAHDEMVDAIDAFLGRQIGEIHFKRDEAQAEARKLGFDGRYDLNYDARDISREIDGRLHEELGSIWDVDRKYEEARVKVLAATTPEEAAEIVKPLL